MVKGKEPDKVEASFRNNIQVDHRPWGKFRSYPYADARSIKIITVNPGQALSLQYHRHRDEFWVVLDKGLEITVGDQTWPPEKDEEIFIPRNAPHRLRCLGPEKARVMEIWIGESDEDDIVRLEDDYDRGIKD
jgi:mannose-6-phosphate isomerase-like protein (cupin superfamily)